ncbi:MAG: flagellar biosynthesis anti-sigma factor FlgM [Steroidobacteraceae bacterium]
MTDKIKGAGSGPIDAGASRPVDSVRPKPAISSSSSESQSSATSDTVTVSSAARNMTSLQQAVNEVPDIDTNRVAAVQQALGSGQYKINAGKIADRMIQLEGDLRSTGKNSQSE